MCQSLCVFTFSKINISETGNTEMRNQINCVKSTLNSEINLKYILFPLIMYFLLQRRRKVYPRRKVYRYQKGDFESMWSDALKFAKKRYFNGHLDTRSVQENFNLITSFIQDSADKHIPSKTSRSAFQYLG